MHTDTRPLAMTSPPAWLSAFETAPGWMRWSGAALLSYTLFLLTPTGLRVDGTVWSWKSSYEWVAEPETSTRERALKARLVADAVVR